MGQANEDKILKQLETEFTLPAEILKQVVDLEKSRMYQRKRRGVMSDLRKLIEEAAGD